MSEISNTSQDMSLQSLKARVLSVKLFDVPQDAESLGKLTVSGIEMFVGQAAQQFELFTGEAAPVDVMRHAVMKSL